MRSFKELFTQVHRAVLAAFAFSGLVSILMLAVPLYGWQLLDQVVPQFNVSALLKLSLFAMAAIGAAFVIDAARNAILLRAAVWLDHVPGQLLFENGIRRAGPARDVASDADALNTLRRFLLGRDLAPLLELPWAPIFLAGLLAINPLIALVVLITSVAMIGVTLWHSFSTHKLHDDVAGAFGMRQDFERAFSAHGRLARALGLASGASATWELVNRGFVAGAYRLGKRTLLSRGLANGLRLSCELAILAVGAWLLMKGQITVGGLIAAIFLGSKVLGTLRHFNDTLPELRNAQRAYARLWRLRSNSLLPQMEAGSRATANSSKNKAVPGNKAAGNISLNNVSVTYHGHASPALQEIDLDLAAGECLVISGPGQSGKSTLAAVMAGAIAPSRGRVLLDGDELSRWQAACKHAPIGYAPDEPIVFEGTVHQNIVGFSDAGVMAAAHGAMAVGMHDVLADLPGGYDCNTGPAGSSLSMRHRKAITLSRAVFGAPAVIILDRPELGLDRREIKRLARYLHELHESGTAIVLATNEPQLQDLADRVVLLDNGSICAIGSPDELLEFDDEVAGSSAPWQDSEATLSNFMGEKP